MQTTCLDKRDNESQDISVLSNLVEKLMKEIEFLSYELSILKKEDNPKRKAIASECKSEESSDKPIPTIKTQDIVKKTYEISHCSPTKEDMFKTHMFVSNRGRGEYDTDGPKVLEKIYWKILSPEDMDTKVFAKNYLSEKGFEYLCKNLYFEESHKCRYCGKGETGVPELFNFEDILEEASTSQNDESNDETN
ncbi:hypothetical protein Tco_1142531 [Tanacetum coccineum]